VTGHIEFIILLLLLLLLGYLTMLSVSRLKNVESVIDECEAVGGIKI
jgi:hypothetical protein